MGFLRAGRSGLDYAESSLSDHVRAIRQVQRAQRKAGGSLRLMREDLSDLLAAARELRKIEDSRINAKIKALTGRGRIESMSIADLQRILLNEKIEQRTN